MKAKDTQLSVSLIATSNEDSLKISLKSLKRALEDVQFELVVTQSEGSYDCKTAVSSHFPQAKVNTNEKALNTGACHNRVLRETKGTWILCLADKVELHSQTVRKLMQCMERHHDAGLSGPSLYEETWKVKPRLSGWKRNDWAPLSVRIPYCILMDRLGYSHYWSAGVSLSEEKEMVLETLNSTCILASREALIQVGGFDESLNSPFLEVDLALKLKRDGYKAYQAEGAKCLLLEKEEYNAKAWQSFFKQLKHFNKKHENILFSFLSKGIGFFLQIVLSTKGLLQELPDLTKKEFHKILIFKTGELKDYLLVTPALKALRKKYPQANITVMGNHPDIKVLEGNSSINGVRLLPEEFRLRPFQFLHPTRIRNIRAFLKELRDEKWDLFISFQYFFGWLDTLWPAFIRKSTHAQWSLGLDTDGKGLFLSHKVKDERRKQLHATRKYNSVLGLLGIESHNYKTDYKIEKGEKDYAERWLSEAGISKEDFLIVVNAGANPCSLERTSWPRSYFITLLNQLSERHKIKLLMFCGSDIRERNWVNSIQDRILPRPLLAGPELTLKQKAAIMQKAGLVIANDSDLLHIGLALKCPAIGIFGPTDYQLVATYGDEVDLTAFYRPIDCRPCVNIYCADPVCMKSITPETVLESASKTIESLMSLRTVKKRG